MKHLPSNLLLLWTGAILLAIPGAICFASEKSVPAQIVIHAVRGKRDIDPQKIFASGNPDSVAKLKKLSKEEYAKALRLSDLDRKNIAARKNKKSEEYHYTLESAFEQSRKEQERAMNDPDETTESRKRPEQNAAAGESSFFVSATPDGTLAFFFKHSTSHHGVYEIFLEPLQNGRFGRQNVHLLADAENNSITLLSRHYYSPDPSNPDIRFFTRPFNIHSYPAGKQGRITTFIIPDEFLLKLFGEIPFRGGISTVLKIAVFRWADGEGASLQGAPGSAGNTYLELPAISPKAEKDLKIKAMGKCSSNANQKHLNQICTDYKSLPFYKKVFHVTARLGFPGWFSDYYLVEKKRLLPKELPIDSDNAKQISDREDPGWRIREHQENMMELGRQIRDSFGNSLLLDAALRYDWEKFNHPISELNSLRLEAIRDRVFGKKFLDEE